MNPETHLLISWVIGAKATDNARDCRLVALAGILPDADGLGLLVDVFTQALGGKRTFLYAHYHHYLLHGVFGAVLVTLSQRLDRIFVETLRKWHRSLTGRLSPGT